VSAKKKAPAKKKAVRARNSRIPNKAKKKPATLKATDVRRMILDTNRAIMALESRVSTLASGHQEMVIAIDSTMGTLVHRLALFGDFKHIPDTEGQRLMSVSQGEMTPVYIDWYISTHTREESRKKYDGRLHHLPPYLRDKIQ
jgi:hypothetical protein